MSDIQSDERAVRRAKLAGLRESGSDPFAVTKFDVTATSASIKASFLPPAEGEEPDRSKTVRIAGRIMSRRIMGKASISPTATVRSRST